MKIIQIERSHSVEFDKLLVVGNIEKQFTFYLNRSTKVLKTVVVNHKIGNVKRYLYISCQINEIYFSLEGGVPAKCTADNTG